MVLYSITMFIFLCVCPVIYIIYKIIKSKDRIVYKLCLILLQLLGTLLYAYGDNIGYILGSYGEELGCDSSCIRHNNIAATLALGIAILTFSIIPPAFRKVAKVIGHKGKEKRWSSTLDMMSSIIRIDILYTAVAIMTQTDEFCGIIDTRISLLSSS